MAIGVRALQKFINEEIEWDLHEDAFEDGDVITEVLIVYRGVKSGRVARDGSLAEFHGYAPNKGSAFTTLRGMLANMQDRFSMEAMHEIASLYHEDEDEDGS